MPRPRTVDVVAEWSKVQIELYEAEQLPLKGWEAGWSHERMNIALAWLLYARSEAKCRLRRLKKITSARARREKRCAEGQPCTNI